MESIPIILDCCNLDNKFSYAQLLIFLEKLDVLKFMVIYHISYKFNLVLLLIFKFGTVLKIQKFINECSLYSGDYIYYF